GPDVVRLHGIAQRAGDDIAIGIARHRGDIGIEAHRDAGGLALHHRIRDQRALDRDQALLQHMAGGLAVGDRLGEAGTDIVLHQPAERLLVALPEGLEDHLVRALGAIEELGDVEAGIGGDHGLQARFRTGL
ncbi:hypothetical protein QU38_00355, partial [Staphylococcus aureus]